MPVEPIILDADATRLAQIFSNLLNNAAKYTRPSGTIRLGVERDGSYVTVAITDDGIGHRILAVDDNRDSARSLALMRTMSIMNHRWHTMASRQWRLQKIFAPT